ncbi:MAG: hypothetical protein QOI12_389 [Alphaproteobacteria bacterium]|jgi:hypothetical protein|nr:hypothetical protein [Alphaproteobacteria bacterium]
MDANGMPCRRGLPRETDRAPLTVLQACGLTRTALYETTQVR